MKLFKNLIIVLLFLCFKSYGQNIHIKEYNKIKNEYNYTNKLKFIFHNIDENLVLYIDDILIAEQPVSELFEEEIDSVYIPVLEFGKILEFKNKKHTIDPVSVYKIEFKKSNKITTIKYLKEDNKKIDNNPPPADEKLIDINPGYISKFETRTTILNDAKILINEDEELNDEKIVILKRYNILPRYDSISKNHIFLKKIKFGDIIKSSGLSEGKTNIAKTDVTNFATGMARFLADRAKQELNESFFIQMHKQMERIPELQVYFPESYMFLKRIDANSMYFNLDHLRARFNQDIQKLPFNIYSSTQNEFIIKKYPQFGNLKTYLDTDQNGMLIDYALASVFETQGKVNPKDLLQNFAHGKARYSLEKKLLKRIAPNLESDNIDELYKNIDKTKITDHSSLNILNSIKLAELISNSLLSPDPNRYWVSEEEIKELFTNEKLFQTYIGLVLAKSDFKEYQIHFNGNSFKNLIEETFVKEGNIQTEKMYLLENLVKNMYQSYAQADDVIKEIKNITVDQAIDESYKIFNVFKSNLEVINSQLSTITYLSGNAYQFNSDIVYNYISPAVEISYNLYAKKYSIAIKEFVMLLQHSSESLKNNPFLSAISTTNLSNLNDTTQSYYIELLKQESVKKHLIDSKIFTSEELDRICKNEKLEREYFKNLIKEKKLEKAFEAYFKNQSKDYNKFVNKFATYGTLIASVAAAQNSDEVKAAIEASVLPVGSSRIKRNSDYSITLNAYVGAFTGRAYFKDNGVSKNISTFGVTAPIGVTFSKGNIKVFNQNTALGLTLQLIDLGSLVNFYMKEGDGAQLPNNTKIQLGDIIAPGGLLSYSIGDTPFTILGGMQYVPNLSRMDGLATDANFKSLTWRWHVGVAIDIPLFNIKVWN